MQNVNDIKLKSHQETRNLGTYKSLQGLSRYISVYLLRLRLDLVYIYICIYIQYKTFTRIVLST